MTMNFLRHWSPKVETRAEYRQVGALPYALVDGRLSVLLITARRSGRWIFPKGAIEPNMSASASAAPLWCYLGHRPVQSSLRRPP